MKTNNKKSDISKRKYTLLVYLYNNVLDEARRQYAGPIPTKLSGLMGEYGDRLETVLVNGETTTVSYTIQAGDTVEMWLNNPQAKKENHKDEIKDLQRDLLCYHHQIDAHYRRLEEYQKLINDRVARLIELASETTL